MGDINRDPDLDRTPADPGSDLAETVKTRGDDTDAAGATQKASPLEPAGADDTVKNQDQTAR